jgi:hypothetical protein
MEEELRGNEKTNITIDDKRANFSFETTIDQMA